MQGQKPPTASESRRLEAVASLWCMPCAMDGWDGVLATVQHVVEGKYRLGHEYTWPGCCWHHLGEPPDSRYTIADAAAHWGPSLQHDLRGFEAVFAPERTLVLITDNLLRRKAELEAEGDVLTEEQYGMWVRQEAVLRLNRSVSIGR